MSTPLSILVLLGFCIFVFSVFLRARTGGKYEIKAIDIALIIVPLLFWLVSTGKVEKIAAFGMEFEMAEAFIGASEKPIESQVTEPSLLPVGEVAESIERGVKGSVQAIPMLVERKIEALEFVLGYGGYWGPAIKKYLDSLSVYPFLKYIVVNNQDGTLFGVYEVRKLMGYFQTKTPTEEERAYKDFERYLNRGDENSRDKLEKLPGFIPRSSAVKSDSNKRMALETMEKLKMDSLPVIDSGGRFVGMVERSRLTASLIIDVAKNLEIAK